MLFPEGENDPAVQGPVCPENTCKGCPEGTFHIHTVPSSTPPKITGPEGCQSSHYNVSFLQENRGLVGGVPLFHRLLPGLQRVSFLRHSKSGLVRPFRP